MALNAGTIVLDVHPIGASINRGWIARVDTTRAIEFFSQCYNETIQVLHVGFSILSNSFLQTSVGLICQGMGGCIREEIVSYVGFAVKSVSNTQQDSGQNMRERISNRNRGCTQGHQVVFLLFQGSNMPAVFDSLKDVVVGPASGRSDLLLLVSPNVRLDYPGHPVHGDFSHKRIWMLHRRHQGLQNLVKVHLDARRLEIVNGFFDNVIVQQFRQDALQKGQSGLTDRQRGVRNHVKDPRQEQMQKLQYRCPNQLFRQLLQPGQCQPLGGLVAHVHKAGKDRDAGLGRELPRVHGHHNDLFEFLVQEFGTALDVDIDVRIEGSQNFKQDKEMLDGQARNDLDDIEQGLRRVVTNPLRMVLAGVNDAGQNQIAAFVGDGICVRGLFQTNRRGRESHHSSLAGVLRSASDIIVAQQQENGSHPLQLFVALLDEASDDLFDFHGRQPAAFVSFVGQTHQNSRRNALL